KVNVSLRCKKIAGGVQSLYLDFYPPITNLSTGEPTRREFLKLYIKEKTRTPFDKQNNANTLQLAEQIKQKRINELNKSEVYTEWEKERLEKKKTNQKKINSNIKKKNK